MASNTDDAFEIVNNIKAKSAVWNSFGLKRNRATGEFVPGIASCKKCKIEVKYSGGTSNLATHLERHHKVKVPQSLQKPTQAQQLESGKKQPTLFAFSKESYAKNNPKAVSVTKAIGNFIVKDLRPYSIVENKGFMDLVKVLDPRYDIPSRTYFSKTLIPQFYEEVKSCVLESLSEADVVALTTDGWTSRATESYITSTASMIAPDWSLKNYVLQTRALPISHTGENIAKVLVEAVNEWHIPQAGGIPLVTDNAANMVVAAREGKFEPHIGCYAHTLNLAAQKSLKLSPVARLLGRVRKVVSFFHRSTTAAAQLKAKTKLLNLKDVKLVQDVCTRWNSAVDMLERYLELQPAIYAALLSKEIKHREADVVTLDDRDVANAEEIMTCLVPLRTVTQALCTESIPTISIIMPIHTKLMRNILAPREEDSTIVKQMKTAIVSDLSSRYDKMKEFLNEASALDPRFKVTYLPQDEQFAVYNRLSVEAANVKTVVKQEPGSTGQSLEMTGHDQPPLPLLSNQADKPLMLSQSEEGADTSDTNKPGLTVKKSGLASILDDIIFVKEEKPTKTLLERAIEEVREYQQMSLVPVQENPLTWWKLHEEGLPLLSKLAKGRMCIPATSVPSERVFSTAGDIVTAQRATLNPENIDKLIFLKKNMK